ncbi:hypothetical protein VCUG_02456 [Vavraia culicis subsp. floridensis]|uniref:RRM domain-containing protein n=1 Tax=Vavraia culicis (isolate floridensis) TaxID=948595 RepID=L2GSK1_VAVCU|nr:uncharacterized protein VCUG_02456 [Vavraia culicis subsp. floridensis]ELA46065.1 hypothetical protein VCUG_02456 [Vavraia culicis subsp. floridensis]
MIETEKIRKAKRVYSGNRDEQKNIRGKREHIAKKSCESDEQAAKKNRTSTKNDNQKFRTSGEKDKREERKSAVNIKSKCSKTSDRDNKTDERLRHGSNRSKDNKRKSQDDRNTKLDVSQNTTMIKESRQKEKYDATKDDLYAVTDSPIVYSPKNRLILRKVPLTTERELLDHFKLADKARMLMKNDKFTGTVFLQFMNFKKTKKVLEDKSLCKFNGHTIEVDYCLPREVYLKKKYMGGEDREEMGQDNRDESKNGKMNSKTTNNCEETCDVGNKKSSKRGSNNETGEEKEDKNIARKKQRKEKDDEHDTKENIKNKEQKLNCVEMNDNRSVKKKSIGEHEKIKVGKECVADGKYITKPSKANLQNVSPDTLYNFVLTNLAYNETEQSLRAYFDSFGIIHEITIKKNNDGFCTGTAILAFVKMFKTIQGEVLCNSRTVYVRFIKHTYRIFISSVKKTLTKEMIAGYLRDKGYEVAEVVVPVGGDRKNRGYCFVQFDGENGVKRFKNEYRRHKKFFGGKSCIEHAKRTDREN